ncbi:hypothetical protein ACH495_18980 [Micromonospora sp. NPDC018662]|uniref:hypothetical protein n=1 Tax=Micromonospora sp. NPDC018662 TaxID=3364238 RepID=UPI00378EE708
MTGDEVTLGDAPLRPADVLARSALWTGRPRDPDDPAPPTGRTSVSFGRPLLFPVPSADLPAPLRLRAEATGRRYVGMVVAFDLDALAGGQRYTGVRFEVTLDDEEAVAVRIDADGGALGLAYGLGPPRPLTVAADRAVTAGASRPGWLLRLAPRNDRPRAWSFGAYRHRFGWSYEDPAGRALLPLTYGMHAMLELPASATTLSGRVGLRVETSATGRGRTVRHQAAVQDTVRFDEPLPGVVEPSVAAVRLCMAADVASYSRRPNHLAERTQSWLVRALADARRAAGLDETAVAVQPQGDGQFAVLPVGIDESEVIPRLVGGLAEALRRTNEDLTADERMRLRVALHRGLMKPADSGWVGTAAIAVHRILDSPPLRAALRDNPGVDYVLGVPDVLYRDVLRHSALPPLPDQFREVAVELPEKQFVEHAWIHVPPGQAG